MLDTKHDKDLYLAAHEELERAAAATDSPWLRPIRNAAIARFAELGFPGPRQEDWKFTSLTPLLKVPFRLAPTEAAGDPTDTLRPYLFAGAQQLVFVNG